MAHRTAKKPQVSVILAVRDAQDELVRSAESVLSQSLRDIELVIADCASSERTAATIARLADRDIRVETVPCADPALMAGQRAALAVARAPYALMMSASDWLGPDYLERMLAAARADGAQLVMSSLSVEVPSRDAAGRRSAVIAGTDRSWSSAEAFRRDAPALFAEGGLANPAGKLLVADRLRAALDAVPAGASGFEVALAYLRDVERASMLHAPVYHLALTRPLARRGSAPFDPDLYAACERRHAALLALFGAWGLAGDAALLEPIHRMHLAGIIRCIENASLGAGKLSSIERRQRVQDMIDAPATCDSIVALRAASRDFGLMFAPIARRSASACCMSARISDLIARALTPITRQRAACL